MNWVKEKYLNLSSKERKQVLVLTVFALLAGYMFYAAQTWQAMFHTEKMANRKADRIEKRIGEFKAPELEEGISDQVLSKLEGQLKKQESSLKDYANSLMPIGDATAREALKLELTQLAYANQLRVARMKASELKPSVEVVQLSGEQLRDYLQERPVFKLVLSGQFLNLVSFVDGLNQLKYQVYVSDLNIELLNDQNSLLKVEMELRI
ncbi:hypothetical protein ACMXYX_13310 [Neptuniibacter sp. QD72_48]|uniref:hypothetical protein n=1 Tax=unclassified Neptuniibacter TaxID=2630693 RepID=UPI0039F6B512